MEATRSQIFLPKLSDKKPTNGFKNIPVIVEIDKMVPTNISDAPKVIAKYGSSGILPIWYPYLKIKSEENKSIKFFVLAITNKCLSVLPTCLRSENGSCGNDWRL